MLVMLFAVVAAWAQMQDPTHFRVSQKQVSPTEVEVIFSGTIEKGWHVYSTGLADDGPISATVTTENRTCATLRILSSLYRNTR